MYICTIFKYTIMEHRIKELIKEKGYTQQEFADLLGMSRVGLAQIVNGKPSYPTLEKIATALNVPMWQLFASPDEVKGEEDNNTITCPKCGTKFKMEE
nr:MAG TPA: helix-turn-helix domain protein [Caudoviricetes sp.]